MSPLAGLHAVSSLFNRKECAEVLKPSFHLQRIEGREGAHQPHHPSKIDGHLALIVNSIYPKSWGSRPGKPAQVILEGHPD